MSEALPAVNDGSAIPDKPQGNPKPKKGPPKEGDVNSVDDSKENKPSNAELKRRAKAEKAARRAKEKQDTQAPTSSSAAAEAVAAQKQATEPKNTRRQSDGQGSKSQKRRDSSSAQAQKALPIRSAEPAPSAAVTQQSKEKAKRVAFCQHLYGAPRRSTIAGAGKDVHPAILSLGIQISNYTILGSNARCVALLLAFKRVIESYTTPPGNSLPRHLTSHLSPQIEYIISCRPLSTSQGNAIRWLKVKISEIDPDTPEETAKTDLCEAIDNFIAERITVADQVIATSSADRIRDGDTIMTYGRSTAVQMTLKEAHRQGKVFKVTVIDSRPLFEGKTLATSLASSGLEVQYSLLHGLSHLIPRTTKLLLGAHAMMSNGHLYSRAGTALVAVMAKEHNIPVVVCCESVKFSERVALDSMAVNEIAPTEELILQKGEGEGKKGTGLEKWMDTPGLQVLNLMYDLTPSEFVDVVITEFGSVPLSGVPGVYALSIAS